MAKEVENKSTEEVENKETAEVAIVPDLNEEVAKSVAGLKGEVDKLKAEMSANKVDESKEKSVNISDTEKKIKSGEAVAKWFSENLNKGWGSKGLIEGTPSSGSTVGVPQELQDEILRQMNETGVVRQYATKIPMESQTLDITVTDTEPEAIWGSQAVATDNTSASYTNVKFTRQPLMVKTTVSNPLLQDKAGMVSHLAELGASGIRKAEDRVGFQKLATSAVNEVELTGTLTQGALTYQKLVDLVNAGSYERTGNERLFMHRSTWSAVQGLEDANGNLVQGTDNILNPNFKGVPVSFVNSMTDYLTSDGTNKTYIVYCSLDKALGLGVRNDEQVAMRMSDSATVGGVSMFDTDQTAVKYQVDEDVQVLRPRYVSKLTSAH